MKPLHGVAQTTRVTALLAPSTGPLRCGSGAFGEAEVDAARCILTCGVAALPPHRTTLIGHTMLPQAIGWFGGPQAR